LLIAIPFKNAFEAGSQHLVDKNYRVEHSISGATEADDVILDSTFLPRAQH